MSTKMEWKKSELALVVEFDKDSRSYSLALCVEVFIMSASEHC